MTNFKSICLVFTCTLFANGAIGAPEGDLLTGFRQGLEKNPVVKALSRSHPDGFQTYVNMLSAETERMFPRGDFYEDAAPVIARNVRAQIYGEFVERLSDKDIVTAMQRQNSAVNAAQSKTPYLCLASFASPDYDIPDDLRNALHLDLLAAEIRTLNGAFSGAESSRRGSKYTDDMGLDALKRVDGSMREKYGEVYGTFEAAIPPMGDGLPTYCAMERDFYNAILTLEPTNKEIKALFPGQIRSTLTPAQLNSARQFARAGLATYYYRRTYGTE